MLGEASKLSGSQLTTMLQREGLVRLHPQRGAVVFLPTVADLRERRTEILRANLREALLGDGFDRFRGVVEPLTDEFDLVDIALAAVSLIEGAGTQDADEVELFSPPLNAGSPPRGARPMPGRPMRSVGPGGPRPGPGGFGPRLGQGAPGGPPRGADRPGSSGPWVRLFVGGGRRAGLRPGDLVGAITNEAHVPGGVVGAIQINEGFSLVDVQEGVADAIIAALREATIRGKRLQVRRDD